MVCVQLSKAEAATRQRPQTFWTPTDMPQLVMVHNRSEEVVRVGERVYFKSTEEATGASLLHLLNLRA